jgi:hypothetical protein
MKRIMRIAVFVFGIFCLWGANAHLVSAITNQECVLSAGKCGFQGALASQWGVEVSELKNLGDCDGVGTGECYVKGGTDAWCQSKGGTCHGNLTGCGSGQMIGGCAGQLVCCVGGSTSPGGGATPPSSGPSDGSSGPGGGAVPPSSGPGGGAVPPDVGSGGGTVSPGTGGGTAGSNTIIFKNPLQFNTVQEVFGSLLGALQGIIVTLSLIFIVLGGLMYITSAGDDKRMSAAKAAITAAVIGLVIGIAAPSFLKEISLVLGWNDTASSVGNSLSLTEIALNVLNFLLSLVGILGLIMLVIGGFMYITAAGDEKRIDSAKDMVKYSVIGIAIALAAMVIVRQVASFFDGGGASFF